MVQLPRFSLFSQSLFVLVAFSIGMLLMLSLHAYAQLPPGSFIPPSVDPASLLNTTRKTLDAEDQKSQPPLLSPDDTGIDTGQTKEQQTSPAENQHNTPFLLREVEVNGVTLLTSQQVTAVLSPYVDQMATLGTLEELASAITQL
jgi:hemolysin activation/secretion protein